MEFKAGALVRVRNRDWVVQPSNDNELVLLKPLGGSEEEITGIYLPFRFPEDTIESTEFPDPSSGDIGEISSARLLYNASRLSFRNGAGPFRSFAKLSFRPRSYQAVPLIMALKQDLPVRILIADDVGVGKTIEALLILKELLERREIKRFAIIVLPHLCEQWQEELKDKFGIEAVIIRSNTQAKLDREIHGDTSVYEYYPYQIISIDYIKSDVRRQVFIQECPELVIVDEAHTCAVAEATNKTQQQRHRLIKDISKKPNQSLILLTATPHSGKSEQFNSLLGLIDEKYQTIDIPTATDDIKKEFAQYYIQRRRADVEKWLDEDTPFPKRDSGEFDYSLSDEYSDYYDDVLDFTLNLTKKEEQHEGRKRFRYWSALALLRGVMSSPDAGVGMLKNRISNLEIPDDLEYTTSNPLMDDDYGPARDYAPTDVINKTVWTDYENRKLNELADKLEKLTGFKYDYKAREAYEIVKMWLADGYNTIVFCRFIATANYLGELLNSALKKDFKNIDVQVVTSEDPDELRKSRIEEMGDSKLRVLVATDCLSEGINLQDKFTAVLHYDLPWNPNRLEQREGRIDRFGQTAKEVKTFLLHGKDNPIDGIVLKVLLRKVREIRRSIGISIPFPEDSKSLIDSVMHAVLLNVKPSRSRNQITLDFGQEEEVKRKEIIATNAIQRAADREKASRSIFAHHAIKADEIEVDLKQSDESIGDTKAVENFVTEALASVFGVQVSQNKEGYDLYTTNLPSVLKNILPDKPKLKISFYSPTPEGYLYIGRNHLFVEQLCQILLAGAIDPESQYRPARASVIKSRKVDIKTTLLLFRVRNVIEEKQTHNQVVAEEMLIWGYKGAASNLDVLSQDEVKKQMKKAEAHSTMSKEAKEDFLKTELDGIDKIRKEFDDIAIKRAEKLIESHERFRKLLGGTRYKVVEPILPMDLMGVYIILPDKN